MKNKILFLIACIGFLGCIYLIYESNKVVNITYKADSEFNKYDNFIRASGIIESANIRVASNVAGVVKKIHVKVNDKIKKGDLLFEIDDSLKQINLKIKEEEANKSIELVKNLRLSIDNYKKKYDLAKKLLKSNVISEDDFLSREYDYLDKLTTFEKAKSDEIIAKLAFDLAKKELDLLKVKSMVDGIVLQTNIKEGEFASFVQSEGDYKGSLTNDPLMIIGSNEMFVRVDIDENEIHKFKNRSKAICKLKGDLKEIDLSFVRIEPYTVPKTSLSGGAFEKIDTRVVQVIYSLKDIEDLNIFVGSQVDIFIELNKK